MIIRIFPTWWPWGAMTIWPFIFVQRKMTLTKALVNHERIHIAQQIEMFWLFFFVIYVLEFIIKLFVYRSWYKAYKNISFEREANRNEDNFEYLLERDTWDWIHYVTGKRTNKTK